MYDLAFAKGGETTRPNFEIHTRRDLLELVELNTPTELRAIVYSGRVATLEFLKDPESYGYGGFAKLTDSHGDEVRVSFPLIPEKKIDYWAKSHEKESKARDESQIVQAGETGTIHYLAHALNAAHKLNRGKYPEPLIRLSTDISPLRPAHCGYGIKAILSNEVSGLVDFMTPEHRHDLKAEIMNAIFLAGELPMDDIDVRAIIKSGERIHFDCPGDSCGLDSSYNANHGKVEFIGHNVDTAAQQLMLLAGLAVIPTYLNKT